MIEARFNIDLFLSIANGSQWLAYILYGGCVLLSLSEVMENISRLRIQNI